MKLRRVLPLVIGFVLVPAALMLTVGILILVYGSVPRDYVFGWLIVALVTTTIGGSAAVLAVIFREARLAKLQTDFVNKVSHDLRTPLTSIRMFVETLQLGRIPDEARQREALEIISEETARLSALINRLLDWARMESGRRTYQLVRQPVGPIVDAALEAFEAQLLQSPAEVERRRPPDLPPVFADREALTEALVDLLQNAHKYTGAEKRITVRAVANGPDGPALRHRQRPGHPRARAQAHLREVLPGARSALAHDRGDRPRARDGEAHRERRTAAGCPCRARSGTGRPSRSRCPRGVAAEAATARAP